MPVNQSFTLISAHPVYKSTGRLSSLPVSSPTPKNAYQGICTNLHIILQIFLKVLIALLLPTFVPSFPLLPHLAPFGSLLQMAEEGMEGMENMEGAAMAGEAAMGAADMTMMGMRLYNLTMTNDY